MFKKTNKSNTTRRNAKAAKQNKTLGQRIWQIITAPFRAIAYVCKRVWNWLCDINLVGVINLTLLVAIIVLFSMLIFNFTTCRNVLNKTTQTAPVVQTAPAQQDVIVRPVAQDVILPVKRDIQTNETVTKAEPIHVARVKPNAVTVVQIARNGGEMYGDIIIENRADSKLLHNGDKINGNLFLQNMRKYVLPCGIKIDGDLVLRNVNLLQFCGEFTVTGNIYVNPTSSFGPIPRTARIGGQVIL